MSQKRSDKKSATLEPQFKEILVCQSKKARPFIEIFVEKPENISHDNLGMFFGVLEINDESVDSSYVVNYLISILKKEYYLNPRRGAVESFEAALHKANLALAKLAEHESTSWIGRLNAVCAVLEKNNIHLSRTGTASAYLIRSKTLVNISEQENDPDNLNPLKTFQEVVSGNLKNQDKLIITTDAIFNIFSLEEIKRSAIKFSNAEFIQFLNTALINELERSAVLIIDLEEKEMSETAPTYIRAQKINAFSREAFAPKKEEKNKVRVVEEERKNLLADLKKELEKSQDGYIDQKSGHIYIKDDGYPAEPQSVLKNYSRELYERVIDSGKNSASSLKNVLTGKITSISLPRLKSKYARESGVEVHVAENESSALPDSTEPIPAKKFHLGIKISGIKNISLSLFGRLKLTTSSAFFRTRRFILFRITLPTRRISAQLSEKVRQRAENRKTARGDRAKLIPVKDDNEILPAYDPEGASASRAEKVDWLDKLSQKKPVDISEVAISPVSNVVNSEIKQEAPTISLAKLESFMRVPTAEPQSPKKINYQNFLPSFSRMKRLISHFDRPSKIYAVLIVLVILIVPYFIARGLNTKKPVASSVPAESQKQETILPPLASDKNVKILNNLAPVLQADNISRIINVNGKILGLSSDAIISAADNKNYPLPDNFKDPELVFPMNDLNLIFILKNGQILSWSAASGKFQPNNITLPDRASIKLANSYLTYIYLLDSQNNQIYRYPRATGGFGDKINWLKDTIDLSSIKDMAVSDNVYLTDGKNIMVFSRGKKQNFNLETTATPISIDKIFTQAGSDSLYILDKNNSRIIKIGKDGSILAQYYNPEIGNAIDFSVNEDNQTTYISNGSGIKSFEMN